MTFYSENFGKVPARFIRPLSRITISLGLLVLSLGANLPFVNAAGTYALSPTKIVLDAQPGSRKQITIMVTNETTVSLSLKAIYSDFVSSNDGSGNPSILTDGSKNPLGISSWLQGAPTISVGAGKTASYLVTLQVPSSATSGTHYGIVRFQSTSTSASLASSIGSLIFVNVGTIQRMVTITKLDTSRLTITQGTIAGTLTANIQNTGNGYTTPSLKVAVYDPAGRTVTTADLNPQLGGVLPFSSRTFSAPVSAALDPTKDYTIALVATTESGTSVKSKTVIKAVNPPSPSPLPSASPSQQRGFLAVTQIPGMYLAIGAVVIVLVALSIFIMAIRKRKPGQTAMSQTSVEQQAANTAVPNTTPQIIQPSSISPLVSEPANNSDANDPPDGS